MSAIEAVKSFPAACPAPGEPEEIRLAHGGGGRFTQRLIEQVFLPSFDNRLLETRHDGAVFRLGQSRLAFTTDSYVIRPLFFPGGDIGSLAVNGTVNDLSMCGARPLYLSAGFILEEGLPIEVVKAVARRMGEAAAVAGVQIVTGDTKVVDRGKGDGLYVNTAGVGIVEHEGDVSPKSVRPGDLILLNGDIGRHGTAVMSVREGLQFESPIESDCQPLSEMVLALLNAGVMVHCLRDLTRGGLATAIVEISQASGLPVRLEEKAIPVSEPVRGACEILGLDPLYIANEGRFVAFVPSDHAGRALEILKAHTGGRDSCVIGQVCSGSSSGVTLSSQIGSDRLVDLLSGEQLPRIC